MATKKRENLARAIIEANKKKVRNIVRYVTEDRTGMTDIGSVLGSMKESLANTFAGIYKAIKDVVAGENADSLPDDLIVFGLGENADNQGVVKYTFKEQEKFPGIESASISVKVGAGSADGKYKIEIDVDGGGDALKELAPEDLQNTYGDIEVTNLDNFFSDFAKDLCYKYFEAFKKILGDTEATPAIEKDVNKTFFDTLVEKVNQKFTDTPAFGTNASLNVNYDKNLFNLVVKNNDGAVVMSCQYLYSIADKSFTLEHATGADNIANIVELTADNIDAFVDALATDFAALNIEAPKAAEDNPPAAEDNPPAPPAADAGGGEKNEDKKKDADDKKKGNEKKTSEEEEKEKLAKFEEASQRVRSIMEARRDYPSQEDAEFMVDWLKAMGSVSSAGVDSKIKEAFNKADALRLNLWEYAFGAKSPWKVVKSGKNGNPKVVWDKEKAASLKLEDKMVSSYTFRLEYKVGDEATVNGEKRKIKAVNDKEITYTDEKTGKEVTVPLDSFTEQTAILNANDVRDFATSQQDALNPALEVNHSFGDTNGKPSGSPFDKKKKISRYTEDVDDIDDDAKEVLFVAADEDQGKEIMDIIKSKGVLEAIEYIIEKFGKDFEQDLFTDDYEKDLEIEEGARIATTNRGETLVYKEDTNEVILMKNFNRREFCEAKKIKAKIGARAKQPKVMPYRGYRSSSRRKYEDRSNYHREDRDLLVDEVRGIYIPQFFAENYGHHLGKTLTGITEADLDILEQGPDAEDYWETWDNVLRNAEIMIKGEPYHLEQDGDLFLVPDDESGDEGGLESRHLEDKDEVAKLEKQLKKARQGAFIGSEASQKRNQKEIKELIKKIKAAKAEKSESRRSLRRR